MAGAILLAGCSSTPQYSDIPLHSEQGFIQAVIEIPAGTNHKIEYNYDTNTFPIDQKNGKDRVVEFLPYPGNYGFIPSTYMNPEQGGDGDALDVLVIGESVPTGTVMEIRIIGAMQLMDGGEVDTKIIATSAYGKEKIIFIDTFNDLQQKYPAAQQMLVDWFLNYKGQGAMEFKGWGDEEDAIQEIFKWRTDK